MKRLFYALSALRHQLTKQDYPAELSQSIDDLTAHYQQADTFLNTTSLDPNHPSETLASLPRILVLGRAGSGKTTLLANSGCDYIFSKSVSAEHLLDVAPTQFCDWWVTDQRAFLDCSGQLFEQAQDDDVVLWRQLVDLMQHSVTPISGILLTVNITDLLSNTYQDKLNDVLNPIRRVLTACQFGSSTTIPVYVVFTKMDQIEGFAEFFNELSRAERKQVWGFDFSQYDPNTNELSHYIHAQFNALIKRLNQRLIAHLHHEHHELKRGLIKDFPLALENLKSVVVDCLQGIQAAIGTSSRYQLQAGCFCSSIQKENPSNQLLQSISETFALQTWRPQRVPKVKSYFCHDILAKQLNAINQQVNQQASARRFSSAKRLRQASTVFCAAVVLLVTVNFAHAFNNNVASIAAVEGYINQYQLMLPKLKQSPDDLKVLLTATTAMRHAKHTLNQLQLTWLFRQSNVALKKLKRETDYLYQHALNRWLAPLLYRQLEQQLYHLSHIPKHQFLQSTVDQLRLYGTLNSYMMFTDVERRKIERLQYWLPQHVDVNLSAAEQAELIADIAQLFHAEQPTPSAHRQQLVWRARHRLRQLSLAKRAYVLLQFNTHNTLSTPFSADDLNRLSTLFVLERSKLMLPVLFTTKGYKTLYVKQILSAIHTANVGNWLMKRMPGKKMEHSHLLKLEKQISQYYLKDYNQYWAQFLNAFKLKSMATADQQVRVLSALTQTPYLLNHFVSAIVNNTTLAGISLLPQFDTLLHPKNDKTISIGEVQESVNHFAQTFLTMYHAKARNQRAFEHLIQQLHTPDNESDALPALSLIQKQLPSPLQQWMNEMTTQTWQYTVDLAQTFIKTQWQADVLPAYRHTIAHRYPIDPLATDEIDLEDFIHFFSPGGTIDNFYSTYLVPLISIKDDRWRWRSMNGATLDFSQDFLNQIRRALIIKSMFFHTKEAIIDVPFKLYPVSLEPIVKSMTLNIDDQKLVFTQRSRHSQALHWPSDKSQGKIDLRFNDINGRTTHVNLSGQWALFRLFSRANLTPTENPKHYNLTLDLNGNAAKLQLQAKSDLNAFIPHVLEGFRCPTHI